MTRLFSTGASLALVLLLSIAAVGCGKSSSNRSSPLSTGGNAGPPSSSPNPGPAGPPGPPGGANVVAQLTGDNADQVSPQLQNLVTVALQRGDADDPLEGF